MEWYHVLIHTREKNFKRNVIYCRAFFWTLESIRLSPRDDAFRRIEEIQKKSAEKKPFFGNEFRRGGLSDKPFKSIKISFINTI